MRPLVAAAALAAALPAAVPAHAEVRRLAVDAMAATQHWQLGGRRVNYTLGRSALAASGEQTRDGAPAALKLTCDFGEPQRDYVSAYHTGDAIPGVCREVSFWLFGSRTGCRLRLSLEDARGRWFEHDQGLVDWEGWKQVSAPVGDGKGWRFLARRGEEPLPILHPVNLRQIAFIRGSRPGAHPLPTFYLHDLRATTDVVPADFAAATLSTGRPGNLFRVGETPALRVRLAGGPQQPIAGRLSATVTDFFHRAQTVDLGAVALPAGGAATRHLRCPTRRLGVYEVRLSLKTRERERLWLARFAVTRPLPARPADPKALFGSMFNLAEFPAEQRPLVARLNRDAGIRWTRLGLGWGEINPAPGVWAWDGPQQTEGPVGRAVDLRGQAYRLPHAPALSTKDAVAIAFWARATGANDTWQCPLQKWGGGARRNYGVYFHLQNGRFHFSASFTRTPERGWSDFDSGFCAWDGQWHHYAATYSREAKQVALYVDGALARSHPYDGGELCTNGDDLVLGGGCPAPLDEMLLYRRALAPDEVALLARKGSPPRDGLVAWWGFDVPGSPLKDGSPNHLDFAGAAPPSVQAARACRRSGLQVLGLLGFPPSWASTAPANAERPWVYKPKLDAWAAFVENVARRYKDTVQHWELWNEPNIDVFWLPKPDPKEFLDVVRAGYAAAKRGNPRCTVIMPGLAGPGEGRWGMDFLDGLLRLGAARYCDAIALHPYRQATPEESDLVGDLRHIAALARQHGARRRIWFTENCWTTHIPGGSTEARQALMLPRCYVLSLATGLVERLLWFRLHDSGVDRFYTEDNYGLCCNDLTPKPAYFAHRTVATLLEGAVPEGAWDVGSRAMARCFRTPAGRVAAVWSPSGTAPVCVYAGRPSVRAVDLMGNETALLTRDGVLFLQATEAVLFLRGLSGDARGRGSVLEVTPGALVRGARGSLTLRVRNPFGSTRPVEVAVHPPAGVSFTSGTVRVSLPPNSARRIALPAAVAPDADPGWRSARATAVIAGEALLFDLPVAVRGAAPDAGPAGYWKLDEGQGEVIHDSSGGGNDGRIEGPHWVEGRKGTALQFDGKGTAVIPSSPSLNLRDEVTLAFWLKPLGDTGTWQFPVAKYYQENIRRNYGFYLSTGTLAPAFSASWERGTYLHNDFGTQVSLQQRRWYHLAATCSIFDRRLRVYVDGRLETDVPCDMGALLLTTDPVRLGTGTLGAVDEVMIYPRALRLEEVAALAR